ncbi:MAG: BCD family MFS transporter [Pseudomonadota bacterium]
MSEATSYVDSSSATTDTSATAGFGWIAIFRLGLVQTCFGAIVVLMTSTMNRVMTVELMLPAMLPGALVALHYFVQLSRPGFGHASDRTGRRSPWVLLGLAILAGGAVLAATATAVLETQSFWGTVLAVGAFGLIGAGVGAGGTSLLALLAAEVPASRRAAAGCIVWIMMITGFVATTILASSFLDPFSTGRLILVTASVSGLALIVATLALTGLEPRREHAAAGRLEPDTVSSEDGALASFRAALGSVWNDAKARQFTTFVFVSMLAYSAQDLILEPFAGLVFDMTPGESTRLSGTQHQGVLLGMIMIAFIGTRFAGTWLGSLRFWTVTGCMGSAAALVLLAVASYQGPPWPVERSVFLLGLANGMFAVAAIARMMALAGAGPQGQEGVRMGMWGAAQAIAFALGGFLGTATYDLMKLVGFADSGSYALIFAGEAAIFLVAAYLASRIESLNKPAGVRTELRRNATWRLQS